MPNKATSAAALEVHPVAALFPMLGADDLAELTKDIKTNGLMHPVVVHNGELLDGRNRLAACLKAKVKPHFAEFSGPDPVAFIISSNVHRRHLNQGQKAMVLAKVAVSSGNSLRDVARNGGLPHSTIGKAAVVLEWAPELVDQVLAGGSLNEAYDIARGRKQATETAEVDWARVREEFPKETEVLQHQIDAGDLTVAQAVANIKLLVVASRTLLKIRNAQDRVKLLIERMPEVDIVEVPDLSLDMDAVETSLPPDIAEFQLASLDKQEALLQTLHVVQQDLRKAADIEPDQEVWWPTGQVYAVRSAISQIVSTAYAIAARHNALLNEPRLKKVP